MTAQAEAVLILHAESHGHRIGEGSLEIMEKQSADAAEEARSEHRRAPARMVTRPSIRLQLPGLTETSYPSLARLGAREKRYSRRSSGVAGKSPGTIRRATVRSHAAIAPLDSSTAPATVILAYRIISLKRSPINATTIGRGVIGAR
jgi:hypothetical protein